MAVQPALSCAGEMLAASRVAANPKWRGTTAGIGLRTKSQLWEGAISGHVESALPERSRRLSADLGDGADRLPQGAAFVLVASHRVPKRSSGSCGLSVP